MTKHEIKNILGYCGKATNKPWPTDCLTLKRIQRWLKDTGAQRPEEDIYFISSSRSDLPRLAKNILTLLENYGLNSIDELEQELIKR